MKERLIQELETLSKLKSEDVSNYIAASLLKDLDLSVEELSRRAKAVFKDILQAYEQVAISTIDKFNHILIRSFSRDLNLPSDFEVSTREKEIFGEAIDELISRVGKNTHITKHLINYVQFKLDEESKVNIRKALEDLFALCIGEASYQALDAIGKLEESEFEIISDQLFKEIGILESKLQNLGKQALELIQSAGLSIDDFSYGKGGVCGLFIKLRDLTLEKIEFTSRANSALEGSWMTKKAPADNINALHTIQDDLHKVLSKIQVALNKDLSVLKLKHAVRSNMDLIAVLTSLSEIFNEICASRRIIPISRFNKIISDALRKEPVSFIYEQIGARYDHILIDEFQDTSQLQWYNLLPLIDESIARGKFNMVVGDAKQSIYRWRGGKAEQLIDLPNLFEPPIDLPFGIANNLRENSEIHRLQINYRSLENIVDFNNELIGRVSHLAIDQNSIYAQEYVSDAFEQESKDGKAGGYIELNEISESDDKNNWAELLRHIEYCITKGYQFGDMAILVRSSQKEGKSIARILIENNIPVVSKESYDIAEYYQVKMILAFLKLSLDQADNPSKIQIIKGFEKLNDSSYDIGKYIFKKQLDLNKFLIDIGKESFKSYQSFSAYDAIEQILSDYLPDIDHPAIDSLKEYVYATYGLKDSISIFLENWENQTEKPGINLGGAENSIELLTIHKAKGLQYKVVFIPELAWKLRPNNNEIGWFSMEDQPVNLTFAPLKINGSLNNMGLEKAFEIEENASRFDNLNLLYVAVTRAEEALFLTTYNKGKGTVGEWMHQSIDYLFGEKPHTTSKFFAKADEDKRQIKIGELSAGNLSFIDTDASHTYQANIPSKPWKTLLKFGNVVESSDQKIGNTFHQIISKSNTLDSFINHTERLIHSGILHSDDKNLIIKYAENLFSNSTFMNLLKNGKVLPEREIFYEKQILRPDLVVQAGNSQTVIDFKTGDAADEHMIQLRQYVKACQEIDQLDTKGFLIYLEPFRIEPLSKMADEKNAQIKLF